MPTVMITGGGSGLGRALAHAYATRGWRVAVSDIDGERAERTRAALPNAPDCLAMELDVTRDAHFVRAVALLRDSTGTLDVLVNNAGIGSAGRFDATPLQEWDRVLAINLMGVVRGCHHFFELLRDGSGHVVNIASFAGIANAPGMAAYNVAKAGVVSLSETLRGEWASQGIGCSVVCPSFFRTNLLDDMRTFGVDARGIAGKLMDRSPLDADDVAGLIVEGVARRRFMIIPHRDARLLRHLKRLFPESFLRHVRRKSQPMLGGR